VLAGHYSDRKDPPPIGRRKLFRGDPFPRGQIQAADDKRTPLGPIDGGPQFDDGFRRKKRGRKRLAGGKRKIRFFLIARLTVDRNAPHAGNGGGKAKS